MGGRLLAGSAKASAISRRSAASSRASRRSRSSADTMAAIFLPRRPRVMRSRRYATRLTRSASCSRASLTGIMSELYALYLLYGQPGRVSFHRDLDAVRVMEPAALPRSLEPLPSPALWINSSAAANLGMDLGQLNTRPGETRLGVPTLCGWVSHPPQPTSAPTVF